MKDTPWDAVILAMVLVLIAVVAWGWDDTIRHSRKPPSMTAPRDSARERAPVSDQVKQASEVPAALLEAVLRANPFSPQRRQAPVSQQASTEAEGRPPQPSPPQFIYKGRILMGTKQRAILEEAKSQKTYFLQVGQEVAGFKVLDISETQVVLSDPTSQESLIVSLTPKP